MKRLFYGLIVASLMMVCSISGFAASPLGPTVSTLTTAEAWGTSTVTITIGSTTGMTVSTQPGVTAAVLIDGELQKIISVVSSTQLSVSRRFGSTIATAHSAGSYVVYGLIYGVSWDQTATGSPTYGNFLGRGVHPTGACLLTSQQYSPVFETVDLAGNPSPYADACVGGYWARGAWPAIVDVTAVRQCTIQTGSLALTAYGTDATRVDGTIYVGSLDVPGPSARVVKLLSSLTGTTAPTTDKQIFSIYDSNPGTLLAVPLASSAIAGVAAATADIFFDQNIALVGGAANTTLILVPGRYFFALQLNGGTTTIQMVATGTGYVNLVGDSRTGVFGTLPAITLPTTLTTSTAPIGCIG